MKDFWNQRYSEAGWAYGQKPNEFFQEVLSTMPPGRLLLPAEGEGRNAIFAARSGWKVEAFDFSLSAQQKALEWARMEHVSIDYSMQDISSWEPISESYDVVALLFVHVDPVVRVIFHQKVAKSLRQGGKVIIEAFRPEQIGHPSGGPKDSQMLYTSGDLCHDFEGLSVEFEQNWSGDLQEGRYHVGHAETIRMVWEKN